MKKLIIAGLILAIFSSLIVGCSSDDTTTAATTTTTTTTTSSPTETQVRGGTLKIANSDAKDLGYPARLGSIQDYMCSAPAVESLAHYDKAGNMVPWLATGWTVDDATATITLSLRKNVKFHDGTDFNAEAVKFNLELFMAENRGETGSVASIDVIDDSTVKVQLAAWDNTFISMLGTVSIISPTAFQAHDVDWAIANPVGTGPFVFESWERDVSIKYNKFDNYWQAGKPYLDSIEFVIIADTTVAVASFMSGEVDVLGIGSPDDFISLEEDGSYDVITLNSGGSQLAGIGGDGSHPNSVYANVKVREAISYAIDTEAIASGIFKGQAIAVNQWAIPSNWGYNSDMTGFPYNPEKAKELLAEAGYPDGFDTTLYGPPWTGTTPLELAAVQSYLGKVGINVSVDTTGTWSTMIREGWNDCLIYICPKLGSDVSVQMRQVIITSPVIFGVSLFHNDEIDQLMNDVTSATDMDVKTDLLHQLQQVTFEKYAQWTPIRVTSVVMAKYPYLHDDGLYTSESTQWNPQDAWLGSK